jgi:hypothetical protein
VIVVPIPARSRSERDRSWIRPFAVALQAAVERPHRHLRGDLAGLRAAHPVRDDEQRRAREEAVLVALALAADVGVLEVLGDPQHRNGQRS